MKLAGITALFIFLCFGGQVYAQNESFVPEWAYGVNGGLTFSGVGFNSYLSVPQESLMQFSGGVAVRYISEKHFGIQVELNYSQRGWKERTDTVHINRYARSLTYLELPVMTHLYFDLSKHVRLIFNLGPQIGYYLGAKELERNILVKPDPEKESVYYDDPVQKRFDYGLKGAMGLEFRTKTGSFILDGRYYFGLSDIFNNTRADWFQASNNRIIGASLTYLIK
jgi:hypothetical protein